MDHEDSEHNLTIIGTTETNRSDIENSNIASEDQEDVEIANTLVTSNIISPHVNDEIIKEIGQNITEMLSVLQEPLRRVQELINSTVQKYISEINTILKPTRAADILGDAQFVYWRWFPEKLVEAVINTQSEYGIDQAIKDWLEEEHYSMIEEAIENLRTVSAIQECTFFEESVTAYHNCLYNIASLGIIATLDRVLSQFSGDIKSVRIKGRVEAIRTKIEENPNAALDEEDYNCLILCITYARAIEKLQVSRAFDKLEPDGINRHWLVHGRTNRPLSKTDVAKLFTILYGTELLNEAADN